MIFEEFAFASTKLFSRGRKRKLLKIFSDVNGFLNASDKKILAFDIIDEKELFAFKDELKSPALKESFRRFSDKGFDLVMNYQSGFPETLKYIHEDPVALFYCGTLPEPEEKVVAMVGARRCSAYGRVMAGNIAECLAKSGYSVVSGMAYGIDAYSHRGALDGGGKTYAFLGCGLDICYPESNRTLYRDIPKGGAVFSEYAPGTQPLAAYFPDRNRLISGLSKAVCVIEAREKSGSLITADFALDQGRDVYALPGKVTDPLSCGCNRLIAQGAGIVTSPEALACELEFGPHAAELSVNQISEKTPDLAADELKVFKSFDFNAKGIDEVQDECGLTLLELLGIVSSLCQKGYLREVFLNHYVRNKI
ncbi:MAG: DNA-protecting protein DprA [Lachnospiraceae bacterium]|uniref:DNA-protecting protein DprA n=1 Tax=Candidatus Weimeria bifida TaxID=2599074 RepID=A0A6N7IYM1_9FIRM|nr:DNA-protecting protein DprA [Candidatus Weimeria bifida]RRF96347.1 MAG: DNA-protecting protein DprA [Lachnospiraceae bacterium]